MSNSDSFKEFIYWSQHNMEDWLFCDKLWKNHSKDCKDLDIPNVYYKYVYHRYNMSFKDNLIHMLNSTPTFKKEIIWNLYNNYIKEHSDKDNIIKNKLFKLDETIQNTGIFKMTYL